MGQKIDIQQRYINQRFGKLIVIRLVEGNNATNRKYLCKCDCGNEKITSEDNLRRGRCKSCGCLYKNNGGKRKYIKGYYLDSRSKLYGVWHNMVRRCTDPKAKQYKNYGGRGIKICDEWNDYSVFRKWAINTGYIEEHSRSEYMLDRIDNDGNYEPSNCRWTNAKTQMNNRTVNTFICYQGVERTMAEWADYYNIPYNLFFRRYQRGWDFERIITTPKQEKKKHGTN